MFDECLGLIVITKHARNGLLWESGDIIDIFRRLVSTQCGIFILNGAQQILLSVAWTE